MLHSRVIAAIIIASTLSVMPAEAQKASGAHTKVSTWNNYSSRGYLHGRGRAISIQNGGIDIEGGGHSNMKDCHYCGKNGSNGGYSFKGGYQFERGVMLTGPGSFGLNETTHFGGEGSSWTQFEW
jgi:hypothetical protein